MLYEVPTIKNYEILPHFSCEFGCATSTCTGTKQDHKPLTRFQLKENSSSNRTAIPLVHNLEEASQTRQQTGLSGEPYFFGDSK
jgi:hypothetical protein